MTMLTTVLSDVASALIGAVGIVALTFWWTTPRTRVTTPRGGSRHTRRSGDR